MNKPRGKQDEGSSADEPKQHHQNKRRPRKRSNFSFFASSQFLSNDLSQGAAQTKVEQAGVSDQSPSQRQHAKTFLAQSSNENRNAKNRHQHGSAAANQVP